MSKIDRLRVALKTGAFWAMFKPNVLTADSTPKQSEFEAKSHELWRKYQKLIRLYGESHERFCALYDAHRRDLVRLIKKYETH